MGLYNIISRVNSSLYLNINGYGAGARKKINVYPATSSNDQVWSITNPNSTAQQEVASNSGLTYKLNANRNYDPWSYDHWICDLYTTNADTYLVFEKTSVSNVYRIRLKGASTKNYYLTAAGTSGSQVYFKPNLGTSDKTQQWTLKSVSTASSYPYTYSTNTKNGIKLHIVETPASTIELVNVKKKDQGIPVPYCGCNGGFFNNNGDKTDCDTLNIALNNGAAVGPGAAGTRNTCGHGNIAYIGGQIKCISASTQSQLISYLGGKPTWAQGGGMLYLGDANWETKWDFPHAPDALSTGWTAMVANTSTKKVYLFVTQDNNNKYLRDFRTAIQQHLGITDGKSTNYVGIMLDGGGSSCLRVYTSSGSRVGPDTPRPLCQIVSIKY